MTATNPIHTNAGTQGAAMMHLTGPMVEPFPEPGHDIQHACEVLSAYHANPPQTNDGLQEMARTPRPWDPTTMTGRMRLQLWLWLDEVAQWINTQHMWNTTRPGIPECWPAHPHIAHDLPAVASLRYLAGFAASPGAMENWHQYTLPMFLDRLHDRLADACQPGKHLTRPRSARDAHYADSPIVKGRRERFSTDIRRATAL